MSGGSFNYLCYTETTDLFHKIDDMEDMEQFLIKKGYTDIAKDVRRLIEYCKTAEIRISVLFEQLEKVFHDIEWQTSGDIGDDSLTNTLEQYRKGAV
jgi:hypothetical protein